MTDPDRSPSTTAPPEPGPAPGKAEARAARDDRLKAALRENLKRRKAQARARAAGPDDPAGDRD